MTNFKSNPKFKLVVLFFVLITIIRVTFLGRGMIAIPDEVRYFYSPFAVENLQRGEYKNFLINIHTTQGRPGDAIVRLIPAYLQIQLGKNLGVYQENQTSLIIPTIFNLAVSTMLLFVFYKLTKIFIKDEKAVFTALIVYAFLAGSNIYIRHILPYDTTLLLYLFSLYLVIKNKPSIWLYSLAGFFLGAGFTVYPGYYFFLPVLFVLTVKKIFCHAEFISASSKILKRVQDDRLITGIKLIPLLFFLIFTAIPILFMQYTAGIAGRNYIQESIGLSTTVVQGSYWESFTFLASYMIEAEKYIGIFLLVTLILCVGRIVYKAIKIKSINIFKNDFDLLLILLVISYFLQAINNFRTHSVFYGRLTHFYFPFIVIAAILLIRQIKNRKISDCLLCFAVILSIFSFAQFYLKYVNLDYPRDFLYRMGINTNIMKEEDFVFESPVLRRIDSPAPWDSKTNYPYSSDPNFLLVNFGYFFRFSEHFEKYVPGADMKLIYNKSHFLTIPAYQYEGFSPEERRFLNEKKYEMKVYKY